MICSLILMPTWFEAIASQGIDPSVRSRAIPGTWETVFDDGDLLALDKPINTTN